MKAVRRSCIALCLVAAFVAGCGGKHGAPPPPTAAKPVHHRPVVKRHRVVVTVLDGDTGRRVHGALVRIGRFADRANPKGNAELGLRRHAPHVVTVRPRGYSDLYRAGGLSEATS